MNKSIKSAQGGFTLIELIVVIVILGILAATALPRFSNLSGDARIASLNAARGALSATSAMTHGRFLVTPAATQNVEGVLISMNETSGYPAIGNANVGSTNVSATNAFMQAAGLAGDYTAALQADNTLRIVPNGISAAAQGNCFVTYTPAVAVNTAPTAVLGPNATAANCQ